MSVTISIITPSYQQAPYLEAALRSVLEQPCTALEYAVLDGGSTDGSVEIIQRYASRLAWWVSEPDGGQYAALQKGFTRSTGEVMGWLNSDDLLCPWALSVVEEIFTTLPEVEWLTTLVPLRWDAQGRAVRALPQRGYSREGFFAGENLPQPGGFFTGWIQQESTFWRRSLWERAGGHIAGEYKLAGDFELWARFARHAPLYGVETPLGGFRFHGAQKTGAGHAAYLQEAERALHAQGGSRRGKFGQMWRRLAHQSCPRAVQGVAGRLGFLHPAQVCRHRRENGGWRVAKLWS